MSQPTQPPAPFKVGDRVRYKKEIRGSWPEATITEITERGFRYEYDKPFVLGTRIGLTTGGEAFESSFNLWEIMPPPCPNHCGHGARFYRLNDDPRAVEENKLGPICWHEDEDGFCGHRCPSPEAGVGEIVK